MGYNRKKFLLPCSATELQSGSHVAIRDLPSCGLILYNETVSNFFFEFDPQQDIELFLRHAYFGERIAGQLFVSNENLLEVADLPVSVAHLVGQSTTDDQWLPPRFDPCSESLAEAQSTDEWMGQISICSCGIAGCGSQYAWFRSGECLAIFTISGASLVSVDWRHFKFEL